MLEKKILIAGLPDAGKSTYIAALNGVMSQEGDFCLTPADKASEWVYVNELTKKWLQCKIVGHSTDGETKFIKWPLKKKDGQVIDLIIPDMKGETYHDIINDDFDPKFAEFCKSSQGILFFINNMSRFVLKDHAMKLVKEDDNNAGDKEELKKEADKLKLNVLTMPDVTKNLLVIKYLRKLMGNVKIVLAVSSWDVKGDYHSIEDYFKTICPAIYNYVRYNFESYMFCGVSAQGAKYDQPGKDLSSLTEKGQRAYIFTDRKIYDLSTPLEFLISE